MNPIRYLVDFMEFMHGKSVNDFHFFVSLSMTGP